MGVSSSTLGLTQFTAAEEQLFESFSGAEPWDFDSPRWQDLLTLKHRLADLEAAKLKAALAAVCGRVAANGRASGNVATLGALVAARLDKSWFFNSTEIEHTSEAVLLLRVLCQHLATTAAAGSAPAAAAPNAAASPSAPAAVLALLAATPNGPALRAATSPAGAVAREDPSAAPLAAYSWARLLSQCLSFLSDGGCAIVSAEAYELHVQVLGLTTVLIGTQAGAAELVRGHELATAEAKAAAVAGGSAAAAAAAASAGADAELTALVASVAAGEAVQDPFLKAAMLIGAQCYEAPRRADAPEKSRKGGKAAAAVPAAAVAVPVAAAGPSLTRAQALVRALLRNVCIDGTRTEESSVPAPRDESAAAKASIDIVNRRAKAVEAYQKTSAVEAATLAAAASTDAPAVVTGAEAAPKPRAKAPVGLADSLADGLTKAVVVPATLVGSLFFDSSEGPVAKPLAERSALLLLVLAHNFRAEAPGVLVPNPFRKALSFVADDKTAAMSYAAPFGAKAAAAAAAAAAALPPAGGPESALVPAGPGLGAVSFKQLFGALVLLCEAPLGTALLYTLLQTSGGFLVSALSRPDVHALLLPLLQQLYYVHVLGPDHRYLLLVILLLFTQDAAFCEAAHAKVSIPASATAWFKDRRLGDISLGSLLTLCLMRSVVATSALATAGANDSYLHTNAFAALSNLAPHSERVHAYTAQKILHTLHSLHKKHRRLAARLDEQSQHPASIGANLTNIERISGLVEHYEHCITVGCEALLAMCAPSLLPRNVDLLYALLHDRAVLDALGTDAYVEPAVRPLLSIVAHFSAVLRAEEKARQLAHAKSGSAGAAEAAAAAAAPAEGGAAAAASSSSVALWGEAEVAAVLATAAKNWTDGSADAAKARETLALSKYIYSEDKKPELFFVPYCYNLVVHYAPDLCWDAATLHIFASGGPSALYVTDKKAVAPSPAAAATPIVVATK